MKKTLLFIVFAFVCQSITLAQSYEIDEVVWKHMYNAQKAMKKVYQPKDWQKVIKELQKALVNAPNHPFIIYNLGISYDAMGILDSNNYKKAIAYYKLFLALNPSEEDKKEVLGRIYRVELAIQSMSDYSTHNVFVAGYEKNENGKEVATLWLNDRVIRLSDGKRDACASSVYVTGSNLYVAGDERNEKNIMIATLWKNGGLQRLTNGKDHGYATSAFVYNDDVYVAGSDGCYLALWKNGVKHYSNNIFGSAYALYVSNGDIYFAGHDAKQLPALWKNGYLQQLTASNDKRWVSKANSVYVSGEDVYVAGYEEIHHGNGFNEWVAILWKNGIPQILTTEEYYYDYHSTVNGQKAHSVCVSGSDVYVAGEGKNYSGESIAVLWKNGIPIYLSEIESGANSVYVLGKNVYVAEYIMNNKKKVAVMWINGIMQHLGSGSRESTALSIFVQ